MQCKPPRCHHPEMEYTQLLNGHENLKCAVTFAVTSYVEEKVAQFSKTCTSTVEFL